MLYMARSSSAAMPCLVHNKNKSTPMKSTIHATRTLLSTAVALGCSSQLMAVEGGFIEDATATLQAHNY
jgi:hypothetical protein